MSKIDTTQWKEFEIGKLFYKVELKTKKEFNKATDVSLIKTEEFSLPLVNAKDGNNGIMYYGRESDFEFEEMCLDIVSDGAVSTGNVYAQPQKTGVLYNAYLIKSYYPKMSEKCLLFLATIIQKTIKQKYGYENKAGWSKVKDEKIKLPVDIDGNPNFAYMEEYMQNLEIEVNSSLRLFLLV
ncbi:MAG: restriction endonuclease [Clostridia bacterium]|nr:restriction endonuclease [Clostridia bacterium]